MKRGSKLVLVALVTILGGCGGGSPPGAPPPGGNGDGKDEVEPVIVTTEGGSYQDGLIVVETSELGTSALLGVYLEEGSWGAYFFFDPSDLLTGTIEIEMGSFEAKNYGEAGLIDEEGYVVGSIGPATITLTPGRASIELNGQSPHARGRVQGPLWIECYIRDPNQHPDNTAGLLMHDKNFESAYCSQLKKFLPSKT